MIRNNTYRKTAQLLKTVAVYLLFFCVFATEPPLFCLILFGSVALHEAGHLIMARLCGCRGRIGFTSAGIRVKTTSKGLSFGREALIYAAGPVTNLLVLAGTLIMLKSGWRGDALILGAVLNGGLAAFNLLPVSGFDGGGLLRCALAYFLSPAAVYRVCLAASLVFMWSFFSACTFLFLRYDCALYPLFVSVWMLAGILAEDIGSSKQ